MKKLLLGLTLLALFLTNTLHAQCKFDIAQEKFEGYVTLKIKHHDTLKISQLGWSNGATESLIKVKENGSYCVKVQFKNGCIADGCIKVSSFSTDSCKASIVYSLTAGKVQLCARAENVKSYLWSSGEKTQCITPSKIGEYCVKVVSQNGCETKACYNHIIPNIDTCAVKIIKTNLENGALSLCILPIGIIKSLEWSNGGKELCIKPEKAGEFCVNVTYTNGCKAKECIKIESINECKIEVFRRVDSLNKKTYFCVSSKSKIKNTYWSTGDSSSCIVPTKSGEYCVKVVTAEGCITSACIKYQNPSDNNCSVTIIRKVDQVANKTYLCAVTKSTVKSFVWSTHDSSDCIIPQKSGEYCVRIITSDGCETKACVNFVSEPVDTCVVKIINTSSGTGDPTLCILPFGEVKYFEWSNGSKERCIKPEKAGEYCVKVQYANGCTAKECVKIEKVNECKIEITRKIDSITKKTYLCVVSKSKLKTINWSTGDSSSCIIPTKTDEYCVKVVTADGCETKACIKYTLPSGIDSCKVQITKAANTTQPGKYKLCIFTTLEVKSVEWSTSSKERCIETDKPGEYCVKVTFTNGCVAKECIKIENESNECKLEIVKRQDNTLAYLCAVSNKKIKTATWSTGDTTICIKVEKEGEYCVKIITPDGCETRTCIKYTPSTTGVEPSICKIAISRVKRDNRLYLCAETNNPALDNNILWSNGTKGKCIEIKEKGRYCAEISINGCEAKACVTIDSISTSSILGNDTPQKNDEAIKITPEMEGILKVMKFGPNPVHDRMFVDIYASVDHTAKLLLFDMGGNLVTNNSIQLLQGENTVEVNTEALQKGIYYVKVVNADKSETVKMVKAF